jgi:hypothetical protein
MIRAEVGRTTGQKLLKCKGRLAPVPNSNSVLQKHHSRDITLNTHDIPWASSSVSLVSDCILYDRATEVRSPAEAKDFFLYLCVQTGSEAHPASCTMGTRGPFPGAKARPGRDADYSLSYSAEVENE